MTQTPLPDQTFDVAVIGAGSAGLQAAQTLGRMHRTAVVFDTDRHRNDPAAHMHNFLGHDGTHPADLRLAARKDAEAYAAVTFRDEAVVAIAGSAGRFVVEQADGGVVLARRVLLATGVRDTLPDVPGLAEQFGDLVAHCPFCHGHEFAGRRVGLLGTAHAAAMAAMLEPIVDEVVVLSAPVVGVHRSGDHLVVELDGAAPVELGGLFVKTDWTQAAPFAEQLGVEMSPLGAVVVDAFGRTSVTGVYAAGDMAQGPGLPMPMASVLTAAAAGLMAAAACVQDDALARIA